jgi:hypothetical protein
MACAVLSGAGNALVDLSALPQPGETGERAAVSERLTSMAFEQAGTPLDAYLGKFAERGGIVEERIEGRDMRSPSVQLRVLPGGAVELLSTHERQRCRDRCLGTTEVRCRHPAPEIHPHLILCRDRFWRSWKLNRLRPRLAHPKCSS